VEDSASSWAQGGIAAVLDNADSIEAHIRDTITAGASATRDATRFVVENGKRAIEWLIERAFPSPATRLGYHLTREGGHSAPAHHPRRRRHRPGGAGHADRPGSQASQHHISSTTSRST
jgi:aspartate oxidase